MTEYKKQFFEIALGQSQMNDAVSDYIQKNKLVPFAKGEHHLTVRYHMMGSDGYVIATTSFAYIITRNHKPKPPGGGESVPVEPLLRVVK